jgi:hypothetical protein
MTKDAKLLAAGFKRSNRSTASLSSKRYEEGSDTLRESANMNWTA